MFSKEESRKLREEFWISFGKSFPKKWLLYRTQLKGVAFKFHFDTKSALIALEIDCALENRILYWEKLLALEPILKKEYLKNAIYQEEFYLENGKNISRIYVPIASKVSIHNKNSWQEVMLFFQENMTAFEAFFSNYKDLLKI